MDTLTTTAGIFAGIDADKPVNGAVRVVNAPTLFAQAGRGIDTAAGPVAAVAVVGAFATGAAAPCVSAGSSELASGAASDVLSGAVVLIAPLANPNHSSIPSRK